MSDSTAPIDLAERRKWADEKKAAMAERLRPPARRVTVHFSPEATEQVDEIAALKDAPLDDAVSGAVQDELYIRRGLKKGDRFFVQPEGGQLSRIVFPESSSRER